MNKSHNRDRKHIQNSRIKKQSRRIISIKITETEIELLKIKKERSNPINTSYITIESLEME